MQVYISRLTKFFGTKESTNNEFTINTTFPGDLSTLDSLNNEVFKKKVFLGLGTADGNGFQDNF